MTAFYELSKQLGDVDIKHFSLRFPIVHVGDGVFTEPHEISFRFSTFGLDYTAYRTGGDAKLYRELWFEGRYDELAAKINDHWSTVRRPDRELVAATVDGVLVGLMTNYSEIDHETLTDKIESIGLHEFVSRYDLDMLCLRIWMNVDVGEKHLVSLKITNGHSGHVAFGYSASFQVGAFEFDIPMSDRVRHLSSTGKLLENMTTVLEAAREMQITETLRSVPANPDVMNLLNGEFDKPTKKQQNLLLEMNRNVFDGDLNNALEIAIWLGQYTEKRGFKVAASSMLGLIINNFVVES